MNVVVIGAGIIGASISKHLTDRGAKVTIIEAAPGPAAAATGKSWAWLNANYKKPKHYRDLNLRSMQLWQRDYGHLCHFCGSLMLHDERPDLHDTHYPAQSITQQQLQGLEPSLDPSLISSSHHARLFPLEGWCDPAEATQHFIKQAQQQGATVMFNTQVQSLSTSTSSSSSSSSITITCCTTPDHNPQQQQQQQISADAVVLSAGVGSPDLTAALGYKLTLLHKPAAILMTKPLKPGIINHMITTDSVFILQRVDGRFLIGETYPTEAANEDVSSSNAARILRLAAAAVPHLRTAAVEGIYVGYRPYPADGYPVLGWIDDKKTAYVAVTHSGMTLAPLVGQLVAEEVTAAARGSSSDVDSRTLDLLAPYRPDRQFAAVEPGTNWNKDMKHK